MSQVVHVTGWSVAQTCCISQCAKYRKSGMFGYPWEQNPWTDRHETWITKLHPGPYLNFQIWERSGCVERLGACVKYHCLWLSCFFWFLQLAYRSPQWTDFQIIYTKTANNLF